MAQHRRWAFPTITRLPTRSLVAMVNLFRFLKIYSQAAEKAAVHVFQKKLLAISDSLGLQNRAVAERLRQKCRELLLLAVRLSVSQQSRIGVENALAT